MPDKLVIAAVGFIGAAVFTWFRLCFPRFAAAAIVVAVLLGVGLFAWSYEPSAWLRLVVATASEVYAALSKPLMFVLSAAAGSVIARFLFWRRRTLA